MTKRTTRLILALISISIVTVVGASVYIFSEPQFDPRSLPPGLISFSSQNGQQLINESQFVTDFQLADSYFVGQKRRAYCGVASSVMILNALRGNRDLNQDNLFDEIADELDYSPFWVSFTGLSLRELGQIFFSYGFGVQVHYANNYTLDQFRAFAKENLARSQDYLIVNYDRASLGQEPVGHISPVLAYHHQSDRFLIMDVTTYHYPPTWVKASDLFNAMSTFDPMAQKSRGFLVVNSLK